MKFLTLNQLFISSLLVFSQITVATIPAKADSKKPLTVKLFMSVDWEGCSLDSYNISAFNKFRDDYPQIKIIHFLNAAYFLKPGSKSATVKNQINTVIRPGDEVGLHIHALESLVTASGVAFRDDVTFSGNASRGLDCERGHDVPLSIYSKDELNKIIQTSLTVLAQNGYTNIRSFRAGGWVANQAVLDALAENNISNDSSSVSRDLLLNKIDEGSPLARILGNLWPDQNILKVTPYSLQTNSGKNIIEFPDNAALADYVDGDYALTIFDRTIADQLRKKEDVTYFHYGFHQETADFYLPNIRTFLENLPQEVNGHHINIESATFIDMNF